MSLAGKWMPLQGHHLAIPFYVLNEQRAQTNHGQSLERLADRGGLGPFEALAIMEDRKLTFMKDELAIKAILANLKRRGVQKMEAP